VLDTGLLLPSLRAAGGGLPEINPLDPINRGRLGFWPMLEGGGITSRDISGWNRHATFQAIPSRVAARWGRAPTFVRTPNRATAAQLPAVTGLTMAFWMAADAAANAGYFGRPFSSDGTTTARLQFAWDHTTAGYRQAWTTHSGGTNPVVQYPTTLSARQAYFLAASTDGNTLNIYLDGLLVGSTTGASISSASGPVNLGGSSANTAWWAGRAGLFSVWNRALAPSDIQRVYADPLAGFVDPAARLFHAVRLGSTTTYNLTATSIAAGSTVGTPSLTQGHALAADGISASSTVGAPALEQIRNFTATGIAAASTVGTPGLTQEHVLTATGIAAGSSVGVPTLNASASTSRALRLPARDRSATLDARARGVTLPARARTVTLQTERT
jgi:hypothetical protein